MNIKSILMTIIFITLGTLTVILVRAQNSAQRIESREDCPVTQPQEPAFIPPSPYTSKPPAEDKFWYGSNALWTMLENDGIWDWLPYHREDGGHYFNKVVWWNEDYDWKADPQPEFTVSAYKLDEPALRYETTEATNLYTPTYGSAILTGVEVPALGCWKFTGQYWDAELSFVVWIAQ